MHEGTKVRIIRDENDVCFLRIIAELGERQSGVVVDGPDLPGIVWVDFGGPVIPIALGDLELIR